MKRRLLVAVLVAVMALGFAMPAGADTAWDAADVTLADLLNYINFSYDGKGYGELWNYGVVAKKYTQHGHSEANIFVDELYKPAKDPILASHTLGAVRATLTLPEGHSLTSVKVALFSNDNIISGTVKSVDVQNKTEVSFFFPIVTDYDALQGTLKAFFVDAENNPVTASGTYQGLTVDDSSPISVDIGISDSYIGKMDISDNGTYYNNANLFQNGGLYHGLTVRGENIKIGLKTRTSEFFQPITADGTKLTYHDGYYFDDAKTTKQYKIDSSTAETVNGKTVYPAYIQFNSDWHTRFENVYYFCQSGKDEGGFYVKENGKYHKLIITELTDTESKTYDLVGNNDDGALVKMTELSTLLASASKEKVAKVVAVGAPSAEGNSTLKGPKDTNGNVVSFYNVTVGPDSTENNKYWVQRDSIAPENVSTVEELPLADNEYAVLNVTVPSNARIVEMNGIQMRLRTSDGHVEHANYTNFQNGEVQSFKRVIWNIVTIDSNGDIVPFTGTVNVGNGHGGMVLVPQGKIVCTDAADAVTLVAQEVTSGKEIHHTACPMPRTTLGLKAGTTSVTVTKVWNDNNNNDGKRPQSITVKLWKGSDRTTPVDTVTLPQNGNWSYTFGDLSNLFTYQATEVETATGYTSTVTGNGTSNITITNSHTPETVDITGTKRWVDGNNADNTRPESITVDLYKQAGTADTPEKVSTQTVSASNNWQYSFTGRPKYERGLEIKYSVQESTWPSGYYALSSPDNYDITNTLARDISVEKKWRDTDYENKRPEKITVYLLQNGERLEGVSAELSASNDFKHTFTSRPVYDEQGNKYTYSVEEESVNGYKPTYTVSDEGNLIITNSYEKISIPVEKKWANENSTNLPTITVELYVNGGKSDKTITLSENGGWKGTFTDLDRYDSDGNEYVYSVKEQPVTGFTPTVTGTADTGFTITNSLTTKDVKVTKVWKDDGVGAKRPTSISVTLTTTNTAEGSGSSILGSIFASDDWKKTFANVPMFGSDGTKYEYEVLEEKINGYKSEVTGNVDTGFTITNTAVRDIEVTKVWNDANNQDGVRPDEITIRLLANGDTVEEKKLTGAKTKNEMKHTFKDLPKYDEDGEEINYTVAEDMVDGYSCDINLNTFTITNTYTPQTVNISGTKHWNDGNATRPDAIKVNLYKQMDNGDKTLVTSTIATAESDWGYSFDGKPQYEGGKLITYSVEEESVPDGYAATYATDSYDITNTLLTDITVKKAWDDNENWDGNRPSSVNIQLMNGNTQVQSATLSADNNWECRFTGLPMYDGNKEEITYTVAEDTTTNYTLSTSRTGNTITLTNHYNLQPGTTLLRLEKADRLNPSKKLQGAEYTLYQEEACQNPVLHNGKAAVFVTGKDGIASISGLPVGTYWVKETKAPAGYEVDPVPYRVEVPQPGAQAPLVQVSDFPLRGVLRLSKTVTGEKTDKAFSFDILLTSPSGDPIVGSYDATLNGKPAPQVTFAQAEGGAKATVLLKDGETLEISGIRAGTAYTVTEHVAHGYTVTVNGTAATTAKGTISEANASVAAFTNCVEETTTFRVQKVWRGLDKGEKAPGIQLTLYCNGKAYTASTPAPDKNGWYTYTGLPAYVDGQPAVYTAKETPVTGFTTAYLNLGNHAADTTCAYNGGVIENSKVPQTGDHAPLALWATLTLACALGLCLPALRKRTR